jgi:hypothetical protein
VLEWLSRRFDDVLGLLNGCLVILAATDDEWHISRISRADLPRRAPLLLAQGVGQAATGFFWAPTGPRLLKTAAQGTGALGGTWAVTAP